MSDLSSAAKVNLEAARQSDGKFGNQPHSNPGQLDGLAGVDPIDVPLSFEDASEAIVFLDRECPAAAGVIDGRPVDGYGGQIAVELPAELAEKLEGRDLVQMHHDRALQVEHKTRELVARAHGFDLDAVYDQPGRDDVSKTVAMLHQLDCTRLYAFHDPAERTVTVTSYNGSATFDEFHIEPDVELSGREKFHYLADRLQVLEHSARLANDPYERRDEDVAEATSRVLGGDMRRNSVRMASSLNAWHDDRRRPDEAARIRATADVVNAKRNRAIVAGEAYYASPERPGNRGGYDSALADMAHDRASAESFMDAGQVAALHEAVFEPKRGHVPAMDTSSQVQKDMAEVLSMARDRKAIMGRMRETDDEAEKKRLRKHADDLYDRMPRNYDVQTDVLERARPIRHQSTESFG